MREVGKNRLTWHIDSSLNAAQLAKHQIERLLASRLIRDPTEQTEK